jgi:putative membrane protein
MMWGYVNGMGAWGYALMTISTVLFWALIIIGVIALVRSFARTDRAPRDQATSARAVLEQVLAERFAAGEIDEQQYQQRLDVLREHHRPLAKP